MALGLYLLHGVEGLAELIDQVVQLCLTNHEVHFLLLLFLVPVNEFTIRESDASAVAKIAAPDELVHRVF